jgi:hypothetical protein
MLRHDVNPTPLEPVPEPHGLRGRSLVPEVFKAQTDSEILAA